MSEGSRPSNSLSTRLQELDREIGDVVERSARSLLDQIGDRLRQGSEELLQAVQKLSLDLPPSFLAENELAQRLLRGRDDRRRRGRSADRLLASIARIDDAGSQADLLNALLEEARGFASRAAFLLTRPDGVHGWAGRGFGDDVDPGLAELRLSYDDDSSWAELARGEGVVALDGERCARLAGRIGAPAAAEGILCPFVLHGQLGGALYADRLESDERLDRACLQILTHTASQALETLSVRGSGVSPTLKTGSAPPSPEDDAAEDDALDGTAVAGAVVAGAAAATTVAAAAPAVAEPETGDGDGEADASSVPAGDFAPSSEIDSFELEPSEDLEQDLAAIDRPSKELAGETDNVDDLWGDPTGSAPPPHVGQPTVRLDLSQVPGREPPAPPPEEETPPEIPSWELDRGSAADPPPAETPAAPPAGEANYRLDGSTQEVEPVAAPTLDVGEDPTLMSPKTALFTPPQEPEPAAEPAAPTTETPATETPATETPARVSTAASGSSEVVPPADVDGPGLAFAGSGAATADEDAALHEEARRLARLLVSEIKLYNEEVIEEGRREGNIYKRLKDDIDRSRQMYHERIDPRLREADDDYFHQELVQRLAGGDAQLLGM